MRKWIKIIWLVISVIAFILVILMTDEEIIQKIQYELDKIQPFLMSEGGAVEFVKYENNIVYVKFSGACSNCGLIDVTLKDGIEQILINEIPGIKEVRKIN